MMAVSRGGKLPGETLAHGVPAWAGAASKACRSSWETAAAAAGRPRARRTSRRPRAWRGGSRSRSSPGRAARRRLSGSCSGMGGRIERRPPGWRSRARSGSLRSSMAGAPPGLSSQRPGGWSSSRTPPEARSRRSPERGRPGHAARGSPRARARGPPPRADPPRQPPANASWQSRYPRRCLSVRGCSQRWPNLARDEHPAAPFGP